MDLDKIAKTAVSELLSSGKIEAAINASIEKTVIEKVNENLRRYSDFGEKVGEAIKKSLKFERLELPEYNAILLDALRQHIDATMCKAASDSMEKLATELLRTPPESIKLSDLVEAYKQDIRFNDYEHEPDEYITCIVDKGISQGITGIDHYHISLDPKENTAKYASHFRIHIAGISGKLKISSIRMAGGEKKSPTMFIGDHYQFERTLVQLWANKTKIIIDEDAICTLMSEPGCEC